MCTGDELFIYALIIHIYRLETYRIPSSTTPSLRSSSSDQNERIDELNLDQYLPSSPEIAAKFEGKFLFAKMGESLEIFIKSVRQVFLSHAYTDEHVMPQSENIGGMESKVKSGSDDQRYSYYFRPQMPKSV